MIAYEVEGERSKVDNIEIKVLHPWPYEKNRRGQCDYKDGKYIIELAKGASTQTRLHELGHAHYHGQYGSFYNFRAEPGFHVSRLGRAEKIRRSNVFDKRVMEVELDAEIFAYTKMGKCVDWRIIHQSLIQMLDKYDVAGNISWLFNLSINILKSRGIPLSNGDRSKLWWALRNVNEGWALKAIRGKD